MPRPFRPGTEAPRLYLITDRSLTGRRGFFDTIEAALRGGVRLVQLREKDLGAGELLALASRLKGLTSRYNALLLVNDRVDVALASGADGVHLGTKGFSPADARRLIGEDGLIGVSTHSLKEAVDAEAGGADFITFGPVYHTPSKAAYGEPVGLPALRETSGAVDIPIFALGGVKAGLAAGAVSSGAWGVALISAVMASPEPERAASEIISEIAGPSGP